jgi:hypothetical protein
MKLKDSSSYDRAFLLFKDYLENFLTKISTFLPVRKERVLKIAS